MAASPEALDLPRPFGPYTLVRRLAVGGMAEVYVAKAQGIGGFEKLVAIKVIHPRFSEDEHFVQMLVEEAKISVLLTHVNVAQIYDLGCIDDTYCIVMEYIEGADAYRLLKRAEEKKLGLPMDVCVHIAAEVCQGLDYAHRKRDSEGNPLNIVHRDISPQNVLMSFAGEVKVVDFGIAKASLRTRQTEAGVIKGKYYYMSPEQAWGDPMDRRSDVFSTGIVLHELLTGEMVYGEDNLPKLLDRVRKAEVEPPSKKRRQIPPELDEIVMKAVAKDPDDRYQSAHELGQALSQFLYRKSPTFNAARLADMMARLFPEEHKRHTGTVRLPESRGEASTKEASDRTSSPDAEGSMARDEFQPPRGSSVIFDLGDEEGEDATRKDVPRYHAEIDRMRGEAGAGAASDQAAETLDASGTVADETSDGATSDGATNDGTTRADAVEGEATLVEQGSEEQGSGDWSDVDENEPTWVAESGDDWEDATLVDESAERERELEQARQQAGVRAGKPAPPPPPTPAAGGRPPPPARAAQSGPSPAEPPTTKQPAVASAVPTQPWPAAKASPPRAPSSSSAQPPAAPGAAAGVRAQASPPVADPFGSAASSQGAMNTASYAAAMAKASRRRWMMLALIPVAVLALVGVGVGAAALLQPPPAPPKLHVVSVPSGAEVQIDGEPVGTTPLDWDEGLKDGSTYRVRVDKPGYEPSSETVTAEAGRMSKIVAVLRPQRATVTVETDPPNAQVWVDGVLMGKAPVEVSDQAIGARIELRASLAEHRDAEEAVEIEADDLEPTVTLELTPRE